MQNSSAYCGSVVVLVEFDKIALRYIYCYYLSSFFMYMVQLVWV